jgi:hypothetical protein
MKLKTISHELQTYYVLASDHAGNQVAVYVDACNINDAWDTANERQEIDAVTAVQLI